MFHYQNIIKLINISINELITWDYHTYIVMIYRDNTEVENEIVDDSICHTQVKHKKHCTVTNTLPSNLIQKHLGCKIAQPIASNVEIC